MRYSRPSYKPGCPFIKTMNLAPCNSPSVSPDRNREEAGMQRRFQASSRPSHFFNSHKPVSGCDTSGGLAGCHGAPLS